MSSSPNHFINIVQKQYKYKLKGYAGSFTALFAAQIIGLLLSLGGVGTFSSSGSINYTVKSYSADMVIIVTLLWAFITAINITTKSYRDSDFSFVSTRVSRNLANIGFLVTTSVIGGITAMLSGSLLKVCLYFFRNSESQYIMGDLALPPAELLLGILITSAYLFLVSALGYLIGNLVQLHKYNMVLVPALIFGVLFINNGNYNESHFIVQSVAFFILETSPLLFLLKILLVTSFLFTASIGLSNRMEVRG